jgi:hypothetical protein
MSQAEPAVLPLSTVDDAALEKFRRRVTSPLLPRLYFLFKMPLGFFAGMRVKALDRERCEVTLPYGWRTTNPFGSIYFAAHAMAAELSAGTLAMLAVRLAPVRVGMLVVGLEAQFGKKAAARTTFTCEEGSRIFAAVRETVETSEQVRIRVSTVGRLADGTEVARFHLDFSFKRRSSG